MVIGIVLPSAPGGSRYDERFLELSEHGEERNLRERFDAIRRARTREE